VIQCNSKDDDMSVPIRVNDKELQLIKKYAELNGTTVSEVLRNAILEKQKMVLISFYMKSL